MLIRPLGKQLLVAGTLVSFLLLPTTSVFAVTTGGLGVGATVKAQVQDQTMTRLKTRAENEINRRVTSLTALMNRISSFKRVSADQKTQFSTGIQTEITNLNSLKTKIDADTDIATMRTDVQSIVKSFRVYALYIPTVRITANADIILDIANQMQQITQKLQDAVNSLQTAGKDVSQATSAMTERAAKIADAITQANSAISTVVVLTPDGYPGNVTQMKSARDMLQTARKDLRTAQQDAIKVRQLIKSLGGASVQTNTTVTTK